MTDDDVLRERIPLRDAAKLTGLTTAQMVALARRGQFPEILRPTQRLGSVAVDDLREWIRRNTLSPETERQREVFRESMCASPFRADREKKRGRR